MHEEKYSPAAAARLIGVNQRTLTKWAHEREKGHEVGPRVSLIKTGSCVLRCYTRDAIEDFLNESFIEHPEVI